MLVDIQSFILDTTIDAQSMQALDAVEQDETAGSSPEVDDEDAETLSTEESPTMTIEGSVGRGQQTRHKRAQDTAYAMYRRSTHRVVDVQTMVDELNGKDKHDAADKTDDDGSEGRHEVAACSDTYETGQHTVQRQGERRFAILNIGEEHRGHTTCSGSEVGGQEHVRDSDAVHLTAGSQLRAGVETKPAEPENEYTQSSHRQVVARNGTALAVLRILANTGTEGNSTDQGQDTTYTMNDGRTSLTRG